VVSVLQRFHIINDILFNAFVLNLMILMIVKRKGRFNFFLWRLLFVLNFLACLFLSTWGQEEKGKDIKMEELHRISVLADVNWTDTGLDVVESQDIYFKATGGISLQKGNPMAYCGPDGYNLKTVQQPLSDKNIGALIGKVVHLVSVEIDEETGEEIREEIVEEFYVGSENRIEMPISGRLFLGINENVVGDNSGEYKVEIYLNNRLSPKVK